MPLVGIHIMQEKGPPVIHRRSGDRFTPDDRALHHTAGGCEHQVGESLLSCWGEREEFVWSAKRAYV